MKTQLKIRLLNLCGVGSLLLAAMWGCNAQDSGNSGSPPVVPAASNPAVHDGTTGQGRDPIPNDGGVIEPSRPLNPDKFSF